jgi:hypothetical protein
LEALWRLNSLSSHFLPIGVRGVFIRALCQCFGRKWGSRGPLVWPADHLDSPSGQVSWLHRPWALDTPCTDFVYMLAGQGGGADRPHFGSVWPGICAMSSPHVILSVTMHYFGHIEDMHGFWSIVDQQNSCNSLVIITYL